MVKLRLSEGVSRVGNEVSLVGGWAVSFTYYLVKNRKVNFSFFLVT